MARPETKVENVAIFSPRLAFEWSAYFINNSLDEGNNATPPKHTI